MLALLVDIWHDLPIYKNNLPSKNMTVTKFKFRMTGVLRIYHINIISYSCDFIYLKIISFTFSEDRRTANVIALAPGVECLTVDREYDIFTQLVKISYESTYIPTIL